MNALTGWLLQGLVWPAAGMVAAAETVGRGWMACRRPGHREDWFAAARGALYLSTGAHFSRCVGGARAARILPVR